MDTTLLLTWLGLPPGVWPPDDRALLGLPPGGGVDVAEAEQNALERMEWLRPHQLVHPELVTEGMNRLAQALFAVTAPPAEPIPTPAPVPPPPPPAPVVLEAELVTVAVAAPPRAISLPPVVPTLAPLPVPDFEPVLLNEVAPPAGSGTFGNRRKAYRELAFLRRLRRVWDRLGPFAGVPSDPIRSPEAVYIVRTAGRELRELLASFPGAATVIERDGAAVAGVFSHPHPTVVLRDLLPGQRANLAADWASGRRVIEAGYLALRQTLRNSMPRNGLRSLTGFVRGFARENPEWVLAVLTVALLLTGLARVLLRPVPAD
jgi:hypothetical protein